MTKLNLKKLKEVGENATEGPFCYQEPGHKGAPDYVKDPSIRRGSIVYTALSKDVDLRFFCEARNNWQAMVETLESAKYHFEFMRESTKDGKLEIDGGVIDVNKWLERFEDD